MSVTDKMQGKGAWLASDALVGLAVAIVAFLVYANSLGNAFVWDDDFVILANLPAPGHVLSLLHGIDSGRPTELMPYYRPLTLFSFVLERQLHGLNPFLVRLCNVLLHAANCLLVHRLALSVATSRSVALLAGLLFALHPLQSEGVDFNAGGRNTMLATFFVLAAYLVHKRYCVRKNLVGLIAGPTLFWAGLFAKETALAILPFIVALELPRLRSTETAARHAAWKRLIPYVAGTMVYLLARQNALAGAGVEMTVLAGLGERLLNNVYIIPRYLLNVVWPFHLSPRYFIPEDLHLLTPWLVLAWLVIIGIGWRLWVCRHRQVTLFGVAWMVAFWLPVSGIFPIPSAPLADRYCYLPAIGLWLLVADQAVQFSPGAALRRWAVTAAAVVLLFLAVATISQNQTWRSDIILFSRLIEQYPDQAYGYLNLGCAYLEKENNLDLAEKSFEKALALDPGFPRLRTQLGYVRLLRGDFAGALFHYDHALYLNPVDTEALLNRGKALEELGRHAAALDSYRRFLAAPGNSFPGERQNIEAKVRALANVVAGKK